MREAQLVLLPLSTVWWWNLGNDADTPEPCPYHMLHSREWALHQLGTIAELILLAEVWGEPALKL